MKTAIQVLKALVYIVPFIRSLIQAVEVPGNGAKKKEAVLKGLQEVLNNLPWDFTDKAKAIVLGIVGTLIDIIIGVLNIVGHEWGETE